MCNQYDKHVSVMLMVFIKCASVHIEKSIIKETANRVHQSGFHLVEGDKFNTIEKKTCNGIFHVNPPLKPQAVN